MPPANDPVRAFSGTLTVQAGVPDLSNVTILHNRSVAENVRVSAQGEPFDGMMVVEEGELMDGSLSLSGDSLLHSVPLTSKAFEQSFLGSYGGLLVALGLTLFAFSTAIAWSYYGDRAVTYLVGTKWVLPYRCLYVLGFFLATIVDTSLIWLISAVTVALMTLPNLIGMFLMRKEVKQMTHDYWQKVSSSAESSQS